MRASTQEIADLKKSLMENIIFCGVRPKPNDGYYCRNHRGDRINNNQIMSSFEPPSQTQI